jgi:ribosomal protein L11 methyltransferase
MASATAADRRSAFVAHFTTGEQTAHGVADRFAAEFSADDVGISLTDMGDGRWQVALYFPARPDAAAVRAALTAATGRKTAAAVRFARVAATDWVRQSLAGLAPVEAGRFMVHGGHDRGRIPANRIGIEIEAALAFGTGHHGSTRGCLIALDRLSKQGCGRRRPLRILDLGTGSGVLAIAAARMLRVRVLATDMDGSAVRAARANARLNRAGPLVEVVHAGGVTNRNIGTWAPFDLIFANILLGPLQRLAVPLVRLTARNGRIVLSGILPAQANAAIAAYRPLALEYRITLDGWTTLVFRRRSRRRAVAAARRYS